MLGIGWPFEVWIVLTCALGICRTNSAIQLYLCQLGQGLTSSGASCGAKGRGACLWCVTVARAQVVLANRRRVVSTGPSDSGQAAAPMRPSLLGQESGPQQAGELLRREAEEPGLVNLRGAPSAASTSSP